MERSKRRRQREKVEAEAALEQGLVPGRVASVESADGRATARRGPQYELWCGDGWPARIAGGELTQAEAIAESGQSQANVARWQAAFEEDEIAARARANWRRAPEIERMLQPTVEAFAEFRGRYFRDANDDPYLFPPAHHKWVTALLAVVERGGKQMILSPPRHGKSELLTHFCVWLICRRPNIRIIWVSGNASVAETMGTQIMEILERHEMLAQDVLGPSRSFKPASKSGASWAPGEFTVGTRSVIGIKSPTFVGMGPGGKLLSRDGDVIVLDDIVDEATVWNPKKRQKDKEWFITQLMSRKTRHTAAFAIGSRQHHDDLWGYIVDAPGWEVIVEQNHDPLCEIPMHSPVPSNEHDHDCPICARHVDCMLFPELRPMADMQDKLADDFSGREDLFEMVHQNTTRPSGAESLTKQDLALCHSGRLIGDVPPGCRLIAGIDPAITGWMATLLWAVDLQTRRRYLVDAERTREGGQQGALAAIQRWWFEYQLTEWVVETTSYQRAVLQDREIVEFTAEHGITLHPLVTNASSKWDAVYGVPRQMGYFKQTAPTADGSLRPLVDLPWGDAATQAKVRPYETELVRFDPQNTTQHTGDLHMAGWFPESQIRNWYAVETAMRMTESRGYPSHTIGGVAGVGSRSLGGYDGFRSMPVLVSTGGPA